MVKPGQPLYCSGILTGMSFDIQNPNLDSLGYSMFLNVRIGNQRNWIIEKVENLKEMGTLRESKGTLMHDQRIYLIFIMFFLLQC